VRQKMAMLREMPKDGDRKKAGQRLQSESRARVMEVLNEAQKPVYEQLLAELQGARRSGGAAPGRIWVPVAGGAPRAVDVRTGLTDGTSTELMEGPLKEGDEVILGLGETPSAAPAKKGPSGPRMF
jgi:HlyD family secretion protein